MINEENSQDGQSEEEAAAIRRGKQREEITRFCFFKILRSLERVNEFEDIKDPREQLKKFNNIKSNNIISDAILEALVFFIDTEICKTEEQRDLLNDYIISFIERLSDEAAKKVSKIIVRENEKKLNQMLINEQLKNEQFNNKFKINIESLRIPSKAKDSPKKDLPGQQFFPPEAYSEFKLNKMDKIEKTEDNNEQP
jgi:hypothetical protein